MLSKRTDGNFGISTDFYVNDNGPIGLIVNQNSTDIDAVIQSGLPIISSTSQNNADNLYGLSNAIKTISDVSNKNQSDIQLLTQKQIDLSIDNTTNKSKIVSLQTNVNSLLASASTTLVERVSLLDVSLNSLTASTNNKLGLYDTSFNDVYSNINTLKTSTNTLNTNLNSNTVSISGLTTRMGGAELNISSAQTNINLLQSDNTSNKSTISTLQSTVSAFPSQYVNTTAGQVISGQKTFTDWAHFGPLDCASIFNFNYIDFRNVTDVKSFKINDNMINKSVIIGLNADFVGISNLFNSQGSRITALEGATGTKGPTGPTGPQGLPGTNGSTGPQGPTGPQGRTGTTGPQGLPGTTGPQGLPGTNGTNGSTGPTGSQGLPGTNGTNGSTGATGPQGPSGVLQLGVDNTWTGLQTFSQPPLMSGASILANTIPTTAINGYSSGGGSTSLLTSISSPISQNQIGYTVNMTNASSGTISPVSSTIIGNLTLGPTNSVWIVNWSFEINSTRDTTTYGSGIWVRNDSGSTPVTIAMRKFAAQYGERMGDYFTGSQVIQIGSTTSTNNFTWYAFLMTNPNSNTYRNAYFYATRIA